jgi:regulator of PEP synthase PpsR (kinase-PPPase family)
MNRTVFFISDGTAITTETLGHSLLTQFPGVHFRQERIPFVSDRKKALDAVARINRAAEKDGAVPIVFNTIVDRALCAEVSRSQGMILDLFDAFLKPMEEALGVLSKPTVGRAHGVSDVERYEDRMDATNYAMNHDDGMNLEFGVADLILVGVSRSGKTPTCLYMALHFGVKAANYPLTEDDLDEMRLPIFLRRHKHKIVGLVIESERLAQIRETRKPGSRYASLKQCLKEVELAESLLRIEGIPVFHTTHSSIEEIASRVLLELGLHREMY